MAGKGLVKSAGRLSCSKGIDVFRRERALDGEGEAI